jgi:HD domain
MMSWPDAERLLEPLPPIEVPRDAIALEAANLNLSVSADYLANHSFRSFAWAAWFGQSESIGFNPQNLWVASVLHDIGLTEAFRAGECFEVDGAEAAAAFLRERGAAEAEVEAVRRAIVLHMQPSVARDEGEIAYLLDAGVSCDVSGRRYEELEPAFRDAVLLRFPRRDFKRKFTALIADEAVRKPDCMAATYMNEWGLPQRIAAAPFAE